MAYTINKTDGTVVTTITDGTVDNTTSLQLFGKSFSGFGEGLNENLVKLLENAAGTSAPTAPLRGELWFDTNTAQLKVYDGSAFKPTGAAKSQASAPTSASAGDLWHNSTDDQLYVYTGSAFVLVGPVYTAGQTLSGWKIETLASAGGDKVVSSMYVGNTRVAILSKETFTPTVSQSGFAEIKAGFTLNSTLSAVFEGTNTQAANIDVSSTSNTSSSIIAGGNFLRADEADTTTGRITIDSDTGLVVGDAQELSVTVSSNDVVITQGAADKDIIFKINDSSGGGAGTTLMTLDGSETEVSIAGTVNITGNLNVSGAYSYTSSNISEHTDTFIKVNSSGGDVDAGFIVETPDTDDARIFWDASENHWTAGSGGTYSKLLRLSDMTDDGDGNKGTKPLTTDSSTGNLKVTTLTLGAVGDPVTSSSSTTSADVTTLSQLTRSLKLWGGSTISDDGSNSIAGNRYVETSAPTSGQGSNGDLWFVRES